MLHTKAQLINDLAALGICPGDSVLMHSSYKSLGGIEGGAKTFFEGFIELLGEEGTLILPALSFSSVTRENPSFDLNSTPSCVGYLSEYFRTLVPGVLRSMHATHSCCALGKRARELTEGHENDLTPVGENSPFAKLPRVGGKILMLGCGNFSNTSMHGVEETVENPYCINWDAPVNYTLTDGNRVIEQTAYRHYFMGPNGEHIPQRYDRVVDLLDDGEVKRGKVLDAECTLMNASAVWKKGHDKMFEDPFYFVDYPTK